MVKDLVSLIFVDSLLLSYSCNSLLLLLDFIVWSNFGLIVNFCYKNSILDGLLNVLLSHSLYPFLELLFISFVFSNNIVRMKYSNLPPNDYIKRVCLVPVIENPLIFLKLLNLKRISDHFDFIVTEMVVWLRYVLISCNVFDIILHKLKVLNQRNQLFALLLSPHIVLFLQDFNNFNLV